jgi:NAD(P)-dependent dehydrogenase (short-subunit alcohol dehydrogenase family)
MEAKRIVLFGATGGLGSQVLELLEAKNKYEIVGLNSRDINFENASEVISLMPAIHGDIILNFAGISIDGMLHKQSVDDTLKMLDVNICGAIHILKSFLPRMREEGFGRIIFISSILSEINVPGAGIFSVCKAAIEKLTEVAAVENASKGITVNAIQLGYMDGGMMNKFDKETYNQIITNVPSKRLGTAEEIVNCIDFIIETEFLNGSVIKLAGGL